MCCTYELEFIASSHYLALVSCAHSKKLDYKQVEFENELSDVLILPDRNVNALREFTDFLNILGVVS